MDYKSLHRELSNTYRKNNTWPVQITLDDFSAYLHMMPFSSSEPEQLNDYLENSAFYKEIVRNSYDRNINENYNFTLPIVVPGNKKIHDKAIIMLHGLNERRWDKYLSWAFMLSKKTERPVFLFPISYHMNRSPEKWSDPRIMSALVKKRQQQYRDPENLSFANIALSNRLTDNPLRFLVSGCQSATDIIAFKTGVQEGKNPFLKKDSTVDIFAYSIGAFLAEILMLADPDGIFTDSRLFMFCGGSVFSGMYGSSRLIMDSLAYDTIYKYYMSDFDKEISTHKTSSPVLHRLLESFRSLIDFNRFKAYRNSGLAMMRDRIMATGLKKDTVIPFKNIKQTLGNKPGIAVSEYDFPYKYKHEDPFPLFRDNILCREVNRSFRMTMNKAASFLM